MIRKSVIVASAALAFNLPTTSHAYPIDCAIFLCLSGGWPASAECAAARAEFIRRITPVPVEPPLQMWRCPMAASYSPNKDPFEIFETSLTREQSYTQAKFEFEATQDSSQRFAHLFLANSGDVDLSDPAFDTIRSIHVYKVFARQRENDNGKCHSFFTMETGEYGEYGQFSWRTGILSELPETFVGLDGFGSHCPTVGVRAVYVDWRDVFGAYGYEQVNY